MTDHLMYTTPGVPRLFHVIGVLPLIVMRDWICSFCNYGRPLTCSAAQRLQMITIPVSTLMHFTKSAKHTWTVRNL